MGVEKMWTISDEQNTSHAVMCSIKY
jgi:hypothetical protein